MEGYHGLPPAEAVEAELNRITTSGSIRKSRNLSAFLDFIVREEIAGRGERLKAYAIATQALGRQPSFDPALDPIVRVEAARLRRAIERFYAESPPQDVAIHIPVGRYRPDIRYVGAAADDATVAPLMVAPDATHAPVSLGDKPGPVTPASQGNAPAASTAAPAGTAANPAPAAAPVARLLPAVATMLPPYSSNTYSGRFVFLACVVAAVGGYLLGVMSDDEVAQQLTKMLDRPH